ncbi:hypothetical protein ACGFSG_16575 [Streptomyces sp. NPDC048512]|uniref:hypothetical protein n=1 Tax=Streptomyces sp. NPDC048512 TaxID=3365563 RepID=UPI0037194297
MNICWNCRGRIVELVPDGSGGWHIDDAPTVFPSDRTTVLHYMGGGFFAEVNRLEDEWPDAHQTRDAAVVLSLRGSAGIPSATFLKAFEHACLRLRERNVHLILCGVPQDQYDLFARAGTLAVIGADSVIVETPHLMESLTTAYDLAERRRTGNASV